MSVSTASQVLLDGGPVRTLEGYRTRGGGEGLRRAAASSPEAVVEEVDRAGLRGRGGAGFPTAVKWRSVRAHPCPTTYMVCNAAEGEPGTFKDRWLLRRNPYLVVEGLAIAAHAVQATGCFLCLKDRFEQEREAVGRALRGMREAGLLDGVPVEVVCGPDHYLYGEEKAMLEVIEGRGPLPRTLPPYQVGLFAGSGAANPTAVNNVETLANLPVILRDGADRFRSRGTGDSPGTMLFTAAGDVRRPGVYELPLGTPLSELIHDVAGGPPGGRAVKAVLPGVSGSVLTAGQLETPLTFEAMRRAGSALGSGGFIVYDESTCMVAATAAASRFLHAESCGQCPACKQGTRQMTDRLERIERGTGSEEDLERILSRCDSVTGGQRCGLPSGAEVVVRSAVEHFREEFVAHLGRTCPQARRPRMPLIEDFDHRAGRFVHEGRHVYPVDGAAAGDVHRPPEGER